MNLHHQHQYSADRESEKMNEIENLENDIKIMRNTLEIAVGNLELRVAELKKADDVKPVFSNPRLDTCFVSDGCGTRTYAKVDWSDDEEAYVCIDKYRLRGRTFYTAGEQEKSDARDVARAYIIEEINKANKGDNGFKPEGDNFFVEWDHSTYTLRGCSSPTKQSFEGGMYFRDAPVVDIEMLKAYKIVFGI